jgi:uncharacterized repeat protein (TIGR01451 family)
MIRRLSLLAAALLLCFLAPALFAQSADVSVSLTAPSTTFAHYDSATPTILVTVKNSGPATAANVVIDFSPGLSVNLQLFNCQTVTDHVRCTSSAFPVTTVQTSGSMQIQQATLGMVVTMSATASSSTADPNPDNNSSSVSQTVAWESFVSNSGFWVPPTLPQGVRIGSYIVFENDGPSYATDVKITLTLPQHVFFESISPDSPFTCVTPAVGSSGDVVCTAKKVGDTNPGGEIDLQIMIDPATPVGTVLTFPSTLACSDAVQQPPPPVQTSTTVTAPATLTTSLAAPDSVEPGDTFPNTVTVTNAGPGTASTSVTFKVSGGSIPATTGPPVAPAGWSCSVPSVGRAICSTSSFAPGTATFTFPVSELSYVEPSKLTETVTASSSSEVNFLHDTATATVWVSKDKIADFDVTVAAPPIVNPGGTVTYAVTVKNTTVNIGYPFLAFGTTPQSGFSYVNCPQNVDRCALGFMTGGASMTILVTAPVVADSNSKMTGTAVITTSTNVPLLHDPRATVVSSVQNTPSDLAVALTATPAALTVGDTVTFTLLVTNTGQVDARNVTVHAPLPPSLALVSATGQCSGGSDVQCFIGAIAGGAWSTTTITARAVQPGTASVTATAMTDSSDPQASNNSATVSINVNPSLVRRRAVHH